MFPPSPSQVTLVHCRHQDTPSLLDPQPSSLCTHTSVLPTSINIFIPTGTDWEQKYKHYTNGVCRFKVYWNNCWHGHFNIEKGGRKVDLEHQVKGWQTSGTNDSTRKIQGKNAASNEVLCDYSQIGLANDKGMILTITLDECQAVVADESWWVLWMKMEGQPHCLWTWLASESWLDWIASLKPSQAFKKGDFQDQEVPSHCPQVKMYQTRMAMIAAHVVPTSTRVIVVEFWKHRSENATRKDTILFERWGRTCIHLNQ